MSNLKFLRSVVLILFFSFGVARAQYGEALDLSPKTYTSPAGEMVLSVNPGERSGAGKAQYTLKKNGTVVWSAEQASTFWQAAIADSGSVAGYAYSGGYNSNTGEFIIAASSIPKCNRVKYTNPPLSLVDNRGRLIKKIALPGLNTKCAIKHSAVSLGGDQWIVISSGDGDERLSSAVSVNISSGKIIPVNEFSLPEIKSLAVWRDAGIVALTIARARRTLENKLFAVDVAGKTRWNVQKDSEDRAKLFSPEAVTITSTGDVVVLDNIENRLQIFSRDGAYRSSVDLAQACHQQPNYPSGIRADIDGGVIVHDFPGKRSVVRMKLDGTVINKFTAKFADGREFDIRGDIQTAPDGRL